jgi:sec-independent protein translocase protein TatA
MTAFIATPLFINNIGPAGLILIAVVVLVLFGRGKISAMMGEVGKGITAFKKGVKEGTESLDDKSDETTATRDVTPNRDRDNA